MVIHKTERGNDLTARTVDVYTLEELRSCRIEQIIAGIREWARIVQAFPADPTEDHVEDSCAQIADDVLWKIERLLEAVRNGRDGSVNSDFVAIVALKVGMLAERLDWMWKHEDATRKGNLRKIHEKLAQRKGAEANKKRRRQKVQQVPVLLKKEFTPEQLTLLPDTTLARSLANSGLGGDRTVRDYIAQVRRQGLIPTRPEK
jgi:hypothetical protein